MKARKITIKGRIKAGNLRLVGTIKSVSGGS